MTELNIKTDFTTDEENKRGETDSHSTMTTHDSKPERVVRRSGRRGRRPVTIDSKAKLERSRQSARECRARKKLRYQYLEELVTSREKAIYALRDELELMKRWSVSIDSGVIPAGVKKLKEISKGIEDKDSKQEADSTLCARSASADVLSDNDSDGNDSCEQIITSITAANGKMSENSPAPVAAADQAYGNLLKENSGFKLGHKIIIAPRIHIVPSQSTIVQQGSKMTDGDVNTVHKTSSSVSKAQQETCFMSDICTDLSFESLLPDEADIT